MRLLLYGLKLGKETMEKIKKGEASEKDIEKLEKWLKFLYDAILELEKRLGENVSVKTFEIALELVLWGMTENGANISEIARRTGVSKERVRQVKELLKEKGFPIKLRKESLKLKIIKKLPEVERLLKEGLSVKEACNRLGINYDAFLKFLKREFGLSATEYRELILSSEIEELIKEGYTMYEIAKKTGRTYNWVRRWINSHPLLREKYKKMERFRKEGKRKKPTLKKRILIVELLKRGFSPIEVAQITNTYESYVYKIKAELKK